MLAAWRGGYDASQRSSCSSVAERRSGIVANQARASARARSSGPRSGERRSFSTYRLSVSVAIRLRSPCARRYGGTSVTSPITCSSASRGDMPGIRTPKSRSAEPLMYR